VPISREFYQASCGVEGVLGGRRRGQLIAEEFPYGGDRKSSSHDENLKLKDTGIDHHQSSRWQQIASIPEEKLGENCKVRGEMRTTRGTC